MKSLGNNTMQKLFSLAQMGFYLADMHAEYVAAGTWPDDAVEVSPDVEADLRNAIESGCSIGKDQAGAWAITPPAPPPFTTVAAPYLDAVRKSRDAILNRLAGIGFAAMANGDSATVEAIAAARLRLLDITSCASVMAADDLETLRQAVADEYAQIATTLPDEARRAFAENLQ